MIFRNLDKNGDWSFGQGKQNYVAGNTAIGLNIKTRMLEWKGDCFFNTNAGIDYTNRLGSKNQRVLLETDQRRIILTSFGVKSLVSFSSVLNGRDFKANYSANTVFSKAYTDSVQRSQ